jgi:hypothetical protein
MVQTPGPALLEPAADRREQPRRVQVGMHVDHGERFGTTP